jgi:Firmicute plasmid replication protein (RepL)
MARPSATVHRLRPRGRRQVELLQEALDLGGWSEPTRVELNRRLTTRLPDAVEPWSFAMVAASPETVATFLRAVAEGPRGFATLRVWHALAPYVRRDTGEVVCTQRTLARTAGVSIGDVQRAVARLVEIGALLREERGRYRVHPRLMWKGELAKRERAQAEAPVLRLVEPAG